MAAIEGSSSPSTSSFGSARERATDPALAALTNNFVAQLQKQLFPATIVWTDGSCRTRNQAACAMVLSQADTRLFEGSLRLRTSSNAIAELSAVLYTLLWFNTHRPLCSSMVHFLCDNQYVVNALNKECRAHPGHLPLFHKCWQLVASLRSHYTFTFTWIPGHTNNCFHARADSLAHTTALSSAPALDPISHLAYFTGALAPGWVWPSP